MERTVQIQAPLPHIKSVNIWLLVGLRRGGTLQDLGWRRFNWWWLPVAVVVAALTWVLSGWLQIAAQHLFPSAQNTQCTSVKNDYRNYLALAILAAGDEGQGYPGAPPRPFA